MIYISDIEFYFPSNDHYRSATHYGILYVNGFTPRVACGETYQNETLLEQSEIFRPKCGLTHKKL